MLPLLNQFIESLIAMMISIVPPGYSAFSQVPIAYCDEHCQTTKLCENETSWKCEPPRLDYVVWHDLTQDAVNSLGLDPEEARERTKPLAYTRPETYEEGLVRYYIIAKADWDATLDMNRPYCKSQCNKAKFETKKEAFACHKRCLRTAPWHWSRKEHAWAAMTIFAKESGFRADVHGGVTPQGLGDCRWEKEDGKWAKPGSKGSRPILSTCRSFCLGQHNLGPQGHARYAGHVWSGMDLVGIDYESTKRCALMTQKHLARSRLYCTGPLAPKFDDWAGVMFSMYGTGSRCDNKRLIRRGGTFWRYYQHPRDLTEQVKEKLATKEVRAAIDALLNSTRQVRWNSALPEQLTPPNAAPVVEPENVAFLLK